jgi:hypothetical protein
MINSRPGIEHERVRIPACLPALALAVNDGGSNG